MGDTSQTDNVPSRAQVTILRPSGLHAPIIRLPALPIGRVTGAPEGHSHTREYPSVERVSRRRLSGLNTTWKTALPCGSAGERRAPVAASQMIASLSSPPV